MIAAYAERLGLEDPLRGLVVGERPDPDAPPGWEIVAVRSASLNQHDLWTLKGVIGVPFEPPVILGCDGAGVTGDGRDVVIYPCLGFGAGFRMLTDGVDGTFAPLVAVPSDNLVEKPAGLSFDEASCLPTAWLTAWRMLFTKGRLRPGERVLVQGASGGVSTAAVALAARAGAHVTVTSRRADALELADTLGADITLASNEPVPYPADVVIETVGSATWDHTMSSLRFGARVIVGGATSGADAQAYLRRLFWNETEIMGSKMGTKHELEELCTFVEHARIAPPVSQVYDGVEGVPAAMEDLARGHRLGKLVVRVS